jgi:hypothetical protein
MCSKDFGLLGMFHSARTLDRLTSWWRFYDLFLAMWDACYDSEEVGEADQERFKKFLLKNEVIEREEAHLYVGAAVAICALLLIRKLGWFTLKHMIVFLSQHGRLSQPLGVRTLRRINQKISSLEIKVWDDAAVA